MRATEPAVKLMVASLAALLTSALAAGCGQARTAAMPAPPPPKVTTQKPVARLITDYGEFTGRLQAVETVDVRPRVDGYIDSVDFVEGQEVKEGDLLFVIDPRPYEATLARSKADVDRWTAQSKLAEVEVRRYEILSRKNAGSREDLDKAVAQRDEASAGLKSSRAAVRQDQLDVDFTRVTAPIAGRVSRAMVTKGNLVSGASAAATPLTTIVSLDPMYVYFDVDERSLLDYQARQRAGRAPVQEGGATIKSLQIPVWLGLATESDYPHEGRLDFSENVVDAETGTYQLRGVFPNADRILTPGLFARVRVQRGPPYEALLVPEAAIGRLQNERFVLVVDEQGVAQSRTIKLGEKTDDHYQVVTEGLSPADRVIVNGMLRARPGNPVDAAEQPAPTDAGASLAPPPAPSKGGEAEPPAEPKAEGTE